MEGIQEELGRRVRTEVDRASRDGRILAYAEAGHLQALPAGSE